MYVSYASISNYILNFSDIQAQNIRSCSPQKKQRRIACGCNTRPSRSYHNRINALILTLVSNLHFSPSSSAPRLAQPGPWLHAGEGEALLHPPLGQRLRHPASILGRGSTAKARCRRAWRDGNPSSSSSSPARHGQTQSGWCLVMTGQLQSSAAW